MYFTWWNPYPSIYLKHGRRYPFWAGLFCMGRYRECPQEKIWLIQWRNCRHYDVILLKLLAKSTFPLSWVPEVFLACGEESSVLAEGRHIFDRRPKPWQKPETALEESLAPRVHFPQNSHKWNKSQKVRCLIKLRCCLAHKIIFNNNSDVIYQNIK